MSGIMSIDMNQDLVLPNGVDNPSAVYLSGYAGHTRSSYTNDLNKVANVLVPDDSTITHLDIPWHKIRFHHVQEIKAQLVNKYAYSTVNRVLSVLKGIAGTCFDLGLITGDDLKRIERIKGVTGHREPAGRHIPSGEISALLNTCKNNASGVRDAAVISVLYACGLRRAELVGLDLEDYTHDDTGGILRVLGKRNKERMVQVNGGAEAALRDWLVVRGDEPGALFFGVGNRQRGSRLTTQAIYNMLTRRAMLAGIPELSPHDFRRTFVSDLLDRGADTPIVQKLAGHANIATTARYDRRPEKAKRQAVNLLHVPYQRRVLATI